MDRHVCGRLIIQFAGTSILCNLAADHDGFCEYYAVKDKPHECRHEIQLAAENERIVCSLCGKDFGPVILPVVSTNNEEAGKADTGATQSPSNTAPSSPSPQRAKCDGCGADYDPKFAETTCIVCDGIIQPPVAQPTPSREHRTRRTGERVGESYERLAPQYGYSTRVESAKQWDEVPSMNRALMTAVCKETLAHISLEKDARITQLEKGAEGLVKMLEDATDRLEVFAHAKSTVLLDPTKKHEAKYFDTWKRHCEEAYSLIERSRAALLEYQKIKGTK